MRTLITIILSLIAGVLLTLWFQPVARRFAPGPKPDAPCPPFCMSEADQIALNKRNEAIKKADIERHREPAHVGGGKPQ